MYVGHTSEDGRKQALAEHLLEVAKLCKTYAQHFDAAELAYVIGLCHDLGKYSEAFKKRLNGGAKVDHSTAGGLEAYQICGPLGAYCIFGHHGGLPDGGSKADTAGEPTMHGKLKRKAGKDIPDYSAFRTEITVNTPVEPRFKPLGNMGFSCAMMIRMLFSCLVDADFIDTEIFMSDGKVHRGGYDSILDLHQKIIKHVEPFLQPSSDLNCKRNEILLNCISKAEMDKGLYSLTVPTGGGKTLSSLAFALAHAQKHKMDRVIYVIPYTSIIEQNAAVFAAVLGRENVLEHHSAFEYSNEDDEQRKLYLSAENWDAPVVVTTNVQFFESLFAAKTSKCRKLHNITNSVIIFDEAQMLPAPYLLPCTRAIAELVHNFGSTAVLCSATQPALDGFFPPEIERKEICDDPTDLYEFFRRTNICALGMLTDEALACKLNELPQVLCIVNTRKQAQNLYQLLNKEGSYHLSTLMYPEHRKEILSQIRDRLHDGQPCRVVATSLIEAGVDVDFPTVFRAKAGLDSIIQAAGRCNREGKRPLEESNVYVFDPDTRYKLPVSQHQPAAVTDLVKAKYAEDIASLHAIHEYFEKLYGIKGEALDAKNIVSRLEDGWKNGGSFPFKTIGEEFRLIDSATRAVLIPDTAASAGYAQRLREGERGRFLLREVGRYSVNVYENHFKELKNMGIIEHLDSEIAVLSEMGSYSRESGLTLTPEGGKGIFLE